MNERLHMRACVCMCVASSAVDVRVVGACVDFEVLALFGVGLVISVLSLLLEKKVEGNMDLSHLSNGF